MDLFKVLDFSTVPWYHKTSRVLLKTELEDLEAEGIVMSQLPRNWSFVDSTLLYQNWVNFANAHKLNEKYAVQFLDVILNENTADAKQKKDELIPALCSKFPHRSGHFILNQFIKLSRRGWATVVPEIPSGTPWYHCFTIQMNPAIRERLQAEGIVLKHTQFTSSEVAKLVQNWEVFIEKKFDDSIPEAKIWAGIGRRDEKVASPKNNKFDRVRFMWMLSTGLNDRSGNAVYNRFRDLVQEKLAQHTNLKGIKVDAAIELTKRCEDKVDYYALGKKLGVIPKKLRDYDLYRRKRKEKLVLLDPHQRNLLTKEVMEQTGTSTEVEATTIPVSQIDFSKIQKRFKILTPFIFKSHWLKLRKDINGVTRWRKQETLIVYKNIREQNVMNEKEIDWDLVCRESDIRAVLKDVEEMKRVWMNSRCARASVILSSRILKGRTRSINMIPFSEMVDIVISFYSSMRRRVFKNVDLGPDGDLMEMGDGNCEIDAKDNVTGGSESGDDFGDDDYEVEDEDDEVGPDGYPVGNNSPNRDTISREPMEWNVKKEDTLENNELDGNHSNTKWKRIQMKPFIKTLNKNICHETVEIDFDALNSQLSTPKQLKKAWLKLQVTVPSDVLTCYEKVRYLRRILRKRKSDMETVELTVKEFIQIYPAD